MFKFDTFVDEVISFTFPFNSLQIALIFFVHNFIIFVSTFNAFLYNFNCFLPHFIRHFVSHGLHTYCLADIFFSMTGTCVSRTYNKIVYNIKVSVDRNFAKVFTLCLQSACWKCTDNWGRGEPLGSYV